MPDRTRSELVSSEVRPASGGIQLLAWVLALALIGFAVVNVVFELTGRFDSGPFTEYAAAFSIVNWLVAALKIAGAAVAVLSVAQRPQLPRQTMNVLIWAAAGTLGVYALGAIAQWVGMASGLAGSPDQVTPAAIAYVLAFVIAAIGFFALAVSHSRRAELGPGPAIAGAIGGVLVIGLILFALPTLLTSLGIFPG